ncbi:hypothetical protein ASG41_08045 [Modestobacter sp. Leaf380]|nr:hypothetical protein ASG41_08045 [Modestobacter sp. Leaf380]
MLQSVRLGGAHPSYMDHVAGQLDPRRVVVSSFSYRAALLDDWDVLHVHWPENLVRHRRKTRAWVRTALLVALLCRVRFRGSGVVRTLHNVAPHEEGGLVERTVLTLLDRSVTCHVRLNEATHGRADTPMVTIPHGHYRAEMAGPSNGSHAAGRGLMFFGFLRPYKGIDALVSAFADVSDPEERLVIAGEPADEAMRTLVERAAASDPRLELHLGFLPDEELAELVASVALVVLPYKEIHNSGVVFAALSLARPVLVPENDVTAALRREVGPEWVHGFHHPLEADHLAQALAAAGSRDAGIRPDLGGRDWSAVAAQYTTVFEDCAGRAVQEDPR